MNYNDYGHLRQDQKDAALSYSDRTEIRSSLSLPGDNSCPAADSTRSAALAWSGGGAIRRVEVSTDAGKALDERCDSGDATAYGAYPIHLSVELGRKRNELLSRCTDELGQVQTDPSPSRRVLQGAPGSVIQRAGNDNTIQPWRVASDGSVHNGNA